MKRQSRARSKSKNKNQIEDEEPLSTGTSKSSEESDLSFQANNVSSVTKQQKRVAPRSGDQFKIGPLFESTQLHHDVFISSTSEPISFVISARIDRGFNLVDGEWIGYKRNYFTLIACFEILNKSPAIVFNEKFHIYDDQNKLLNIECFAIRLVSECCEDDIRVILVQHTPKRDKGPQYLPPVYASVPGILPDHSIIKQSANIRNDSKLDELSSYFYASNQLLNSASDESILKTYPQGKVSTVAKYERMQFSTSANFRKPALINRHFILKVELLGVLKDGQYTILASKQTPPLVVRGRSPSNYRLTNTPVNPSIEVYDDQLPKAKEVFTKSLARNDLSNILTVNNIIGFSKPAGPQIYEDYPLSTAKSGVDLSNHKVMTELEPSTVNRLLNNPDHYNYYSILDKENETCLIDNELQLGSFKKHKGKHKSHRGHKSKSEERRHHKHKKHKSKYNKDKKEGSMMEISDTENSMLRLLPPFNAGMSQF